MFKNNLFITIQIELYSKARWKAFKLFLHVLSKLCIAHQKCWLKYVLNQRKDRLTDKKSMKI